MLLRDMIDRRAEEREQVARLQELPVFTGVPVDAVRATLRAGTWVTQPERWAVVHKGTTGDAGYLLIEGTAEVRRDGEAALQLKPGDIFGAEVLLRGVLHSATVVTSSRVELLHMSRTTFLSLLGRHGALSTAVVTARAREHELFTSLVGAPRSA